MNEDGARLKVRRDSEMIKEWVAFPVAIAAIAALLFNDLTVFNGGKDFLSWYGVGILAVLGSAAAVIACEARREQKHVEGLYNDYPRLFRD